MKVGLISFHTFSQPGGIKNHILGLRNEFRRRGVESKIIVPRRNFLENYGKDVILLGTSFPMKFNGSQSDFSVNFNPLAIDRVLEREKFDVLHFHNFGFPSALQILEKSDSLNILTFHADIKGSTLFKFFPSLSVAMNEIVKWKMDGVIGVAKLILEIFEGFPNSQKVIPNGINLKKFNPSYPKIRKFSSDKKINLLFVGRIEERKGLIYLLQAYKILSEKFNNLRLIIVGKGDLEKNCQEYVKENKLKEVYFEGEISGNNLASYYNTADIFCSPAVSGESFGIVLLEAMACGKPIVGFSNRGYKELLEGTKGEKFLVEPKNYGQLAEKLELLIKDENLRKEAGEWGLEEVQKYSWEKVAGEVLDFYELCRKEKEEREKKENEEGKTQDPFFLP
ncbi:MAG: hypothetical protein COZ91_02935 [Candidatus Nealsonbacteria bacterium CG_4_8_14_3_um_filter_39_7]|uniref:Glycosyltransferase family 1 protein n=1 Tax=Candidatus Nealsonbacteria bacterium CG23_combo_of_CG06-09_8_20_14_all_39_17 TaxID=1974722 RepID=A0A2G9YU08_9BACT|nr:MAG: hypothetical protein COX37_02495 [Candidatus Nealsonbacteria bacterium CG23_combo_of_CG06-09_8_20_14_all_39_17]PIW90973.1 MAG: hypothetical protein COZ91_02935 [Candidatus Nealsonbacteria bacterium CG_4_8_14_3_um_filter_39_7]